MKTLTHDEEAGIHLPLQGRFVEAGEPAEFTNDVADKLLAQDKTKWREVSEPKRSTKGEES